MLFVPLLWTQSILCGNYIHTRACCVRLRQHPAPVPGGNLTILLRFTRPLFTTYTHLLDGAPPEIPGQSK